MATVDNTVPAGLDGAVFNGPRLFAFEEPYIDAQGDGHYDLGDPYVDCNGDGRWDGNFLGGGSNAPRYYDYVADPPGARAFVVDNGTRKIAVEVLDHEGAFKNYLDAIRSNFQAAVPNQISSSDIFISSTHDESAPDSIGLYGVQDPSGTAPIASSSNPYWVAYMEQQAANAIEEANANLQPATVSYADALEPATFRQCWSSYPFVDDQIVPVMHAVNRDTGATIVTLADVSQHAETLGFNGGSQLDPGAPTKTTLDQEKDWLTADWPYWFRKQLETTYGGVGIEMAGSVGSNETPQVFNSPVSRTPQQFVDAGHPAGCRTEFTGNQADTVPLGYYSEDVALGTQLAQAVQSALTNNATVNHSTVLDGATTQVCLPDTNALFGAVGVLGIFGDRPSYADPNCTVSAPVPPTGNTAGVYIGSTVAAFRIGDGTFAELPGEVFPFTYLRSFLGPNDMPCPQSSDCSGTPNPLLTCASGNPYQLPPWLMPHMHTPFRFLVGLGEDMIGYIFPCGNGVGVPGEYPTSNPQADSTDAFGCGHSDDSESASSGAGDYVGNAVVGLLDHLDGATAQTPEDIAKGRYVLADGTLSRSPLSTTTSVGCSVNTVVSTQHGTAVVIKLADGSVITPRAWMSLDGQPQDAPDRNTRGWIDKDGTRHWLDVFDG